MIKGLIILAAILITYNIYQWIQEWKFSRMLDAAFEHAVHCVDCRENAFDEVCNNNPQLVSYIKHKPVDNE